jgi:exopolysaccharide production protein ExoZ
MKTDTHKYDGVQALRLLAALLVVTTHSFFYASERLGAGTMLWDNGARGVDIFFVISGFVMVVSSRNLIGAPQGWAKFAIQRVTRVVPLYWLVTSIKVVIMLLSTGFVLHSTLDLSNVVKSYLFIPYNVTPTNIGVLVGVGWTLVFEMFFYFVFSLALLIGANIYIFVGVIMGLLSALSLALPEKHTVWMYLCQPFVLEFLFGMFVGYFALNNKFIESRYAAMFSILTTLWIVIFPSGLEPMVSTIVIGIPATLLVYSVVSLEPYLRNKIPSLLLFFGAASYSLYLFHPMVAPIVPVLLDKLHVPVFSLSVSLSLLVALVTAAFVYRYVELWITHALKLIPFISKFTHKSLTEINSTPLLQIIGTEVVVTKSGKN